MRHIGLFIAMVFWLAQAALAQAEAPAPDEPEPSVGYLRIFTDTDLVQIYLDGELIGYSPILDKIPVAPGWHTISFFPPEFPWSHWTHRTRRMLMTVVQAGTQHIMVKPGELQEVRLPWHALEQELERYESGRRISAVVGVVMVAVVLILLGRAV